MKEKTLFMETTKIAPEKTIAEIEACLVAYGVGGVLREYTAGEISSVRFTIRIGKNDVPFRLPARWQAIEQVFKKRKAGKWNYALGAETLSWCASQARRVAWRQVLRWVQAQLALVETNMVTMEEVFFPYITTKSGKTLYEVHAPGLALLPEGTAE